MEEKKSEIQDRFMKWLEIIYKNDLPHGLNEYFSKETSVKLGNIRNWKKGKHKPSICFIEETIKAYAKYESGWRCGNEEEEFKQSMLEITGLEDCFESLESENYENKNKIKLLKEEIKMLKKLK